MGSLQTRRVGEDPDLHKPDFRTSRRNFLAGMQSLAAAGVLLGVGLAARAADAQGVNDGPEPGCSPSGDQPSKCICFLSGTRIATPNSELEIERLQIGDLVMSISGESKPIKWIGRMCFTRSPSEVWAPDVAPVKIARFALDDETPHADLYLSPAHAIYLHGLLVPIRHLVNGRTIIDNQHAGDLKLEYYHIELDGHDAVLAEGAPAETYAGNDRWAFDNADEYERLYGEQGSFVPSFAPIVSFDGRRQELMSRLRSTVSPFYDARTPLDLIRDRIESRAELRMAA